MIAMPSARPPGIFRFSTYEADPGSGELRKAGLRLRLQDQPFQVLLVLLERPGEVVTREELRLKLWPADTFVDFDHGLNTVINKLREALSDSATNPRFIETLARRGYRFLAPVEFVEKTMPKPVAVPAATVTPPATAHEPVANEPASRLATFLTRAEEVPAVPKLFVRVPFLLLQVMYLSFYVATLARLPRVQEMLEQTFGYPAWAMTLLVISAVIGLPIRLYLISAIAFDLTGLSQKFRRLFHVTLPLDELWDLSPFLFAPQI
jgi:DNA-binding winged helix-turn-helix (wHTH) protein